LPCLRPDQTLLEWEEEIGRAERKHRDGVRGGRSKLTFPNNWIAVSIRPARNSAIKMNVPSITHAGCNFFCASNMIIKITKKRVSEPTVTA